MLRMICQRWIYRVGNSTVCVDNAFSWVGWAQERLRVNDETVQDSRGMFRTRQSYAEPWLTMIGEGELSVRMSARLLSIQCELLLNDEPLEPEAYMATRWAGPKNTWPAEEDWRPARRGDFIALPKAEAAKG